MTARFLALLPRAGLRATWVLGSLLIVAACDSGGTAENNFVNAGPGGSSGSGGSSSGGGGSGGSNNGGSSGSGGSAASAGFIIGGNAGSSGNSGSSGSGNAGSAGDDGGLPEADGCSVEQIPPESPYDRKCAPPTDNECDGTANINPAFPNGTEGNGFDDDCDGKVDEGCSCSVGAGSTKPCFLVSGSQVGDDGNPFGFCLANPGTVTCVASGLDGEKTWDGFCKGAQPPYPDDACVAGDYDCDGVDSNPAETSCTCDDPPVTCPTDPVIISPFPDPTDLTKKKPNELDIMDPTGQQLFIVDGYNWIRQDLQAASKKWKWTLTGGDCDNILPYPTFAVFNKENTQDPTCVDANNPYINVCQIGSAQGGLGSNGQQRGWVVGPNDFAHQVWPAFALSGDYSVTGEFEINGTPYSCNLRVQVRQKGLRAELCWDTVGGDPSFATVADVDLHLARLQCNDPVKCPQGSQHGWFKDSNPSTIEDDTYWELDAPGTIDSPDWGYAASPKESCVGWASPADPSIVECPNPRLDKDNIRCNTMQLNPADTARCPSGMSCHNFCGPENINLDNPNAGEEFLVGANLYRGVPARSHINVYCNGVRKLSLGYDPTTNPPTDFPQLQDDGTTIEGDFWTAARVHWLGGSDDPCSIETVVADVPKTNKVGASGLCVETNPQNTTNTNPWLFTPDGNYPNSASGYGPGDLCFH